MCWNTRTFSAASGKKTYFSPVQVFLYGFVPLLFVFSECCIQDKYWLISWLLILILLGEGAFANGEKIHVSQTDKVSEYTTFR